jgi:MATE family multidrug resistance protein
MSLVKKALAENRLTLSLASPMIAGQLGQMMMGWADTIMVGRLGVVPLAACAFAIMVVHVFLVFGFGLITSVSICVSRAFGANEHREAGEFLIAGTVLSAVAGCLMALAIQIVAPWLHLLGQDPEVIREAKAFLILVGWSIVPALITVTGKDYSESLSRPWLPFWIIIGGVGLNIFLNWLFIFGNMGMPKMGLTGAGLGTLVARIAVVIVLYAAILLNKSYRPYLVGRVTWETFVQRFSVLFRLGWPSAVHLLGEVGLFASATLMMGWIGVTALAAHQIALNCAATAFMVPLGLALAVTVRIGQVVGAKEHFRVRTIAFGAFGLGILLMSCFSILFIVCGPWIAQFFVSDTEVIALAAALLVIAGLFGIFDASQIIGMGGLRGLADVRVPMFFIYIAYWCIAAPIAYVLGFHTKMGALGIWAGLLVGLFFTALAITVRLWIMSGKEAAILVGQNLQRKIEMSSEKDSIVP